MGSSVYMRLKSGRLVSIRDDVDQRVAEALTVDLRKWLETGQTLSVAHASGMIEELTPKGVQAIEVAEVPSKCLDPGTAERRRRT